MAAGGVAQLAVKAGGRADLVVVLCANELFWKSIVVVLEGVRGVVHGVIGQVDGAGRL